ncbi:MAG: ABC transporter ATP-binding protein [Betaproteobacteria bacterium]|nr:ABC transporter ATP-binding protein [Betaproteobacteria bacterium]
MSARAGVLLVLPWPLKFIVDNVIFKKPLPLWANGLLPDPATQGPALLDALGLTMLALGLADAALVYFGNRIILDAGQRIVLALRRDLFAHLQRLSTDFHRRHMSGEVMSRLSADTREVQDFISALGIDILPHVLTIVGMAAVMLRVDWRYALITLSVAPLLGAIAHHFAGRLRRALRKVREEEGALWGSAQEVLANASLVQAFDRADHEDRRFHEKARKGFDAALLANRLQSSFSPMMNATIAVATSAITWYGAVRVTLGALTPGDLLIFLAYLRGIVTPARQLAKTGRTFGRAAVAMERIGEYRAERATVAEARETRTPPQISGRVDVRAVSFGYAPQHRILDDISFVLEPGKTVALVGTTGSGKSTLAHLIARFYDPEAGSILFDGCDLRTLPLNFLRRQVAIVPQEPLLFNAPIWENIAYGREGATREDAIEAATAAGVDEVITKIPGGYDGTAGERGLTLSGGQRQCIAIARAMLCDAPVVILDEPSSSLDATTEQRLMRALERLRARRAALVIAHRLSTVKNADSILVLEQGRIVQRGTHAQLLEARGGYADLWQATEREQPRDALRRIAL